ncbi:MAG TPA: hypothetical protein VKG01_04940, partial [Thermoanaerobaculia bacterium]|nr:hypothetical protein [Thermoanaerobaculia bacterium]
MSDRGCPPPALERAERFALPACRERWLDLLALDHPVLPRPADFGGGRGELIVLRSQRSGRSVRDGRIPAGCAPAFFFQAAAASSFFQAFGFPLRVEDLEDAVWDLAAGAARLWLSKTPAAAGGEGPGGPPSEVLAGFLEVLFRRKRSREPPGLRGLRAALRAPGAEHRRAEFWLAEALRSFPELASEAGASARARSVGTGGWWSKTASTRGLLEKARAILDDRAPRVFGASGRSRGPADVLGLSDPAELSSVSRASRALRQRHARESAGAKARWIAIDAEGWDLVSRRAFETAARALEKEVDVVLVPRLLAPPLLPDQWRREIFVPCGSLHASVRFYERFARIARAEPSSARRTADAFVRSREWARFASDPTGEAPLPDPVERQEASLDPRADSRRRAGELRRRALEEDDPPRRVELLLEAGQEQTALAEASRALRSASPAGLAPWFAFSARLAISAGAPLPPWLELVEAEREAAGGRIAEAAERLSALSGGAEADLASLRAARLRLAELQADLGRAREAGQGAAAWRRENPGAAAAEMLRALVLEARGVAREGRHEEALRLLDEADRAALTLSLEERLEAALARAAVFSLAGRLVEEGAVYEFWRKPVLESGEETLAARLHFREALGLADRREFPAAIARLEQALAASRDDLVEQARISICLASTLYHAGRGDACRGLLDRAIELAGAAGRDDLARTARSNRLELLINAGEWDEAASETRAMLERAAAEGDETRLLVALHHASRLALRRGLFAEAERDNARARELAGKLSDRLETGELWLEEGDRLLYQGDLCAARRAYESAADDPPDRCDSSERARKRLGELEWAPGRGPPQSALNDLASLFERDEYAAAEQAARWRMLPGSGLPAP